MVTKANNRNLPITHPDFEYRASKNPYWAKCRECEGVVFTDHDTEAQPGQWRTRIPDGRSLPDRPLHVEIGCNGGHVILEWAARNPDIAYIGMDWKFKQIYRAYEKTMKRNLRNILFLRSRSERIGHVFGEGEIDALHLFFPDPWPKKPQWKHRFVTSAWFHETARIVKPGGMFHIRTDHTGYFEWMEEALKNTMAAANTPWTVEDRSVDLHGQHPDPLSLEIPDVTLFEKIFIRDGIKIHYLKLRRNS